MPERMSEAIVAWVEVEVGVGGSCRLVVAWLELNGGARNVLVVMCCGGWLSVIAGRPESFQRERQH